MQQNVLKQKLRAKRICAAIAKGAFLLVLFLVTVYPVVWMISGSLKGTQEFYTNLWGLPQEWKWENYVDAWTRGELGAEIPELNSCSGGYACHCHSGGVLCGLCHCPHKFPL